MGNLRKVSYQGETIQLQQAARKFQKIWAFNGEMMQSKSRIADLKLGEWVALELWNDTAWPTRCTCMDITFGLSEKEPFFHKKGTLI